MEKRLGKIQILGEEYPLNFSLRISQTFKDLLKDTGITPEQKNLKLLSLLLRDGAAYSRVVLGEEITPPQEEALELIFTPTDNARIVEAIQETLELGGMRLITSAAKKNRAAAGAGNIPKA